MRLFVAIEIDAEVRRKLASLVDELRPLAPKVKWARVENLHLTLKFIGEMQGAKLGAIRTALAKTGKRPPIEMLYQGLGFFPNEKWPRVFWAGIHASPDLACLASDIDAALASIGFQREHRPFVPHLTLARMDAMRLPGTLLEAIAKNAEREFGEKRATEFHLIESRLKPSAAEYTTLQSFAFASEN